MVVPLSNLNQVPPSCQALTKLGLAIAKGSNIDSSLQKMILGLAGVGGSLVTPGGHNGVPKQPAPALVIKKMNDTQ